MTEKRHAELVYNPKLGESKGGIVLFDVKPGPEYRVAVKAWETDEEDAAIEFSEKFARSNGIELEIHKDELEDDS